MARILFFSCSDEVQVQVRQILTPMRISPVFVPGNKTHLTLGELESGRWGDTVSEASDFAEPFLVMCGLTDKQMNRFLMELRRHEVPIGLKAVLTPTNRKWNAAKLYLELSRERAAYRR